MALDPKVFKAYDVRGLYPSELDEEGARAIGRAYVEQFEPKSIAVGRDMRLSSPTMHESFVRGACEAGADVVDIGMVGTEMLYHAVGALGLDGGATITASHNPKDYTGAKIVRRGALPVGGDSGLLDIRDRALSSQDTSGGQTPGHVEKRDVYPGFVDKVMSFIDPAAVKPLRVVIDAANGMAGAMLPPILERLPIHAVRHFFEPDGTFPDHEPNPLLEENRRFIVAEVTNERRRPRHRLRRRRRPLLLRRRHGRVRPRRLRDRAPRGVHAGEGARRHDHLRRPRELGRARHGRAPRRNGCPEPRRPCVHQAADARDRRRLRRRGLRPLLLPRLLPGRLRDDPGAARARARLEGRHEALRPPDGRSASGTSSRARSTPSSTTSRSRSRR